MNLVELKEKLIIIRNSKPEYEKDTKGFVNLLKNRKDYSNEIVSLTRFIDEVSVERVVPFSSRIYCVLKDIHSKEDIPRCPSCKKIRAFDSILKGYKMSCGIRSCYQSMPEVNRKRHETAIENYGSLSKAYNETSRATIREKYGVDHISQSDEIKQKKIQTSLKNYGTEYPWQSKEGKEEQKLGVIKKYGVENVSQLPEVKLRKNETSLENWGMENPSQSPIIRRKMLENRSWDYKLPSGRIVLVESSYEEIIINDIVNKYNEKYVEVQPEKNYKYLYEGKEHYWFPDIIVKEEPFWDILIESKPLRIMSVEKLLWHQLNVSPEDEKKVYACDDHKNITILKWTNKENTWIYEQSTNEVKQNLIRYGFLEA